MTHVVELHGGKLVANDGQTIINIFDTRFMPGDTVSITQGVITLVERKEQAVIATIKAIDNGHAILYVNHLGPSCPFQPVIEDNNYKVGDRLVLWLNVDGSISFRAAFTSDAKDDVPALLKMYSLYKKPDDFIYLVNDYTKPLYTIETVVNHNNLNTFTIDPTNSVDFDDAISVDVKNSTV